MLGINYLSSSLKNFTQTDRHFLPTLLPLHPRAAAIPQAAATRFPPESTAMWYQCYNIHNFITWPLNSRNWVNPSRKRLFLNSINPLSLRVPLQCLSGQLQLPHVLPIIFPSGYSGLYFIGNKKERYVSYIIPARTKICPPRHTTRASP